VITHPPSVAASSEATSKLIEVQSLSHAYQMLTQSRPKTKFAGDAKKVDFEAHITKIESMTNVPGATDNLKLIELEYWFAGNASLVVDQYITSEEPTTGLKEVPGVWA
jgi:hypothetical protein